MTALPERDGRRDTVTRFDMVERAAHWTTALLLLMLIATGAVLYLGSLAALVGRRPLVRSVHVVCGIALPMPFLIAVTGRWGTNLRRDLGDINRWAPADVAWLRRARPAPSPPGKFNAGQKLNAAFVGGTGVVMLMTGLVMHYFEPFPTSWRTGATFAHDWTAFGLGLAIAGHIWLAVSDRDALRGMWSGRVPRAWARRHRPAWLDAIEADPTADSTVDAPPISG